MTRTEAGQASVESLAGLFALTLLLPAVLGVSYLACANLWIEYQLERAALCFAAHSARPCVAELDNKVTEFLPWGTWHSRIDRGWRGPMVAAEFEWEKFGWGKYRWKWRKHLDLERVARAASSPLRCSAGFPCSSPWSRR